MQQSKYIILIKIKSIELSFQTFRDNDAEYNCVCENCLKYIDKDIKIAKFCYNIAAYEGALQERKNLCLKRTEPEPDGYSFGDCRFLQREI